MAIEFVGSSQGGASGSRQVNYVPPAGYLPGDLGVLLFTGPTPTTVPAGWTTVIQVGGTSIYTKTLAASEPTSTWRWGSDAAFAAVAAAYRGVKGVTVGPSAGEAYPGSGSGSGNPKLLPSVVSTGGLLVAMWGGRGGGTNDSWNLVEPMTVRNDYTGGGDTQVLLADESLAGAGPSGSRSAWSSWVWNWGGVLVALSDNMPPNAPTLTSMATGEVVDRSATNRASHTFSDPDAGDSQSKFDHRFRLVGAGTWTEGTATTPNQYVDYPAGTFTAGDYERQVRTYDAQGTPGPWSASGFFTAADPPPTPTITAPIHGATVGTSALVTWSTPDQAAYQLQVLDGGAVEFDTTEVASPTDRSLAVEFPTNNVTRTVRVRVKLNGLWSSWYAITVQVSYTPPGAPVVTLTPSGYALVVQVTNPAPVAGEPVVTHNRVYVDDLQAEGETLRVAALPANGTWTYRLPRGGVDYDGLVRVVAVGDNGAEAST